MRWLNVIITINEEEKSSPKAREMRTSVLWAEREREKSVGDNRNREKIERCDCLKILTKKVKEWECFFQKMGKWRMEKKDTKEKRKENRGDFVLNSPLPFPLHLKTSTQKKTRKRAKRKPRKERTMIKNEMKSRNCEGKKRVQKKRVFCSEKGKSIVSDTRKRRKQKWKPDWERNFESLKNK